MTVGAYHDAILAIPDDLTLARLAMRLTTVLLALAFLPLVGCTPDRFLAPVHAGGVLGAGDRAIAAPEVERRITRWRLEYAARGLTYMSESDYPFAYVFLPATAAVPLAVADFRRIAGIAPDARVEVVDLDAFFARHIERVDPTDSVARRLVPRYVLLRETLRTSARDVKVFRVGEVVVDCWIVGVDAGGNLVGLQTVAIET